MTTQLAPHRMSLPPPSRQLDESRSAVAFLSKLILGALAAVMGTVAIATAPATVIVPIATVLGAGLVVGGLALILDRRWRDRRSDEEMRTFGWLALGAVSFATLTVAVFVPEDLAVALTAVGLAGLIVFRLTASWAGSSWLALR